MTSQNFRSRPPRAERRHRARRKARAGADPQADHDQWDIMPIPSPRASTTQETPTREERDVLISMFGFPARPPRPEPGGARPPIASTGSSPSRAVPEAARLIVVAKSKANLEAIDEIITNRPAPRGRPAGHRRTQARDARAAREQLKLPLAREGTIARSPRPRPPHHRHHRLAIRFPRPQPPRGDPAAAQNAVWLEWWGRSQPSTTTGRLGQPRRQDPHRPRLASDALMILSPPKPGSLAR